MSCLSSLGVCTCCVTPVLVSDNGSSGVPSLTLMSDFEGATGVSHLGQDSFFY